MPKTENISRTCLSFESRLYLTPNTVPGRFLYNKDILTIQCLDK